MAYQLAPLVKENFDFSKLYPAQQAEVQKSLSVAFNLSEVVNYVQKATNNFRVENQIAMDVDNEIYSIYKKYMQDEGKAEPKAEPMEEEIEVETPSGDIIIISDTAKDLYSPDEIQEFIDKNTSLNELLATKEDFGEAEVAEWEETIASLKDLLNS